MQVAGVEVEAHPQYVVVVDQLKDVVQRIAAPNGVVETDFADTILPALPTDNVRQAEPLAGTKIRDDRDFFVNNFTHSTSPCGPAQKWPLDFSLRVGVLEAAPKPGDCA
jgi:hypothetical protein